MYDVIIASRAGEQMLLDALDSILKQTLSPKRVIVVIDDNEPIPMAWWESVITTSPTVELLPHPGRGMASAIGAGIQQATSEYVAFLDADDKWMPEKQFLQIDGLQRHDSVQAITCSARNIRMMNSDNAQHSPAFPCATFTATTFRTTTFQEFGLPDPAASHHAWLYRWWAYARFNGIVTNNVSYTGLHRRIHGANSWCLENKEGHQALLRELKLIVTEQRVRSSRSPLMPSEN